MRCSAKEVLGMGWQSCTGDFGKLCREAESAGGQQGCQQPGEEQGAHTRTQEALGAAQTCLHAEKGAWGS